MESIASDPELGQEVLQLLHRKLQQRRQELEELRKTPTTEVALVDSTVMRAENERLWSELSALELQLSTGPEDQNSGAGSQDSTSFDSEKAIHEAMEVQLQREITQNDTIAELKRKLDKYKEKHRSQRSENVTLKDTLLRVTEDLRTAIDGLDTLQKNLSLREAELNMIDEEPPSFHWRTFRDDDKVKPPKGVPKDKNLKPFLSSARFSHLPPNMLKEHGHLKLLIVQSNEFQWSSKGVNRGLYILPSFTYDPTARSSIDGWTSNQKATQLRSKKGRTKWEVIFMRQNAWYYYGTYQCVGCSPIAVGEADEFGTMIAKGIQDIVLHKDQVAPVVLSFISALCTDRLMGFDIWGFERTGFNHVFNKALVSHKKALQQMSSQPKKAAKKRPQGNEGDSGSSRKKRKTS